jgi:agmatine deiminase
MTIDQEANIVYFSDLIRKNEFKETFKRIQAILDKHKIDYKFLNDTEDIWCRDYMPIQVDLNKFVQFRYKPEYLKDYIHLQSDPFKVLQANGFEAEFYDINIDGGNVIRWTDKVILTTRIFKENPTVEQKRLINKIEHLLEAEVLLIPDINTDVTGHADGHIRFVDSNTVLVNQLQNEYKYWVNGFCKMVNKSGLKYVDLPGLNLKIKITLKLQ